MSLLMDCTTAADLHVHKECNATALVASVLTSETAYDSKLIAHTSYRPCCGMWRIKKERACFTSSQRRVNRKRKNIKSSTSVWQRSKLKVSGHSKVNVTLWTSCACCGPIIRVSNSMLWYASGLHIECAKKYLASWPEQMDRHNLWSLVRTEVQSSRTNLQTSQTKAT